MRISDGQRFKAVLERIQHAKSENLKNLEAISSQRKVNMAHDNPTDYARIIKKRENLSGLDAVGKNIQFARGFLGVTGNALSSIQDSLIFYKSDRIQ